MKLIPNYSYEYNKILNENYSEEEQIKNFASLLSDKDRFLALLPEIEKNSKLIEEKLGFKLREEYEFFVVRGEKFKSFSEPVTVEYSILPEEMILFLLKEILKVSITTRFPDEILREEYVNSLIDYISINGDFSCDLIKYTKNIHDESKRLYERYHLKQLDFTNSNLNQLLEKYYEENPINF